MITRALIVTALILGAGVFAGRRTLAEAPAARQPLAALPLTISEWSGREAAPLADDIVAQLGVDDYLHRRYARASSAPMGLYVGYYASQRQGDTIHSPQNCLPGAGWRPVSSRTREIAAGAARLRVNEYIIQKGLDRQAVLYWYQGRGRVVANEYANKALLMFDAARLNRSDGGLVRVIGPVVSTTDSVVDELSAFVAALFPHLTRHLP